MIILVFFLSLHKQISLVGSSGILPMAVHWNVELKVLPVPLVYSNYHGIVGRTSSVTLWTWDRSFRTWHTVQV